MSIVLDFKNISKLYSLKPVGSGTLVNDLNRWWAVNVMKRDDPFIKIGESNLRNKKGNSDFVWALKNISFQVNQGETVAIIGNNGSGKSTLLKILSRITAPTKGTIGIKGRISSLLEVGTGFNPDLTGRDNVYMNGAILGMSRAEIKHNFDEIVAFAGVERYIDTPVKRYSSGMRVRLGFAVAAFLESDILVVDEVLAVGDKDFRKRALERMRVLSHEMGRTVLFVSHDNSNLLELCNRGILLENGTLSYDGKIKDTLDLYMEVNVNHVDNVT